MKFIRALYLIAALSASSTGMMAQTQSSGYFLHTITKGQSLYSIASMYNVTTGDIVKMNPGSDQKIKIGETLKIPQKNSGTEQQMFHTIQSGETLYKLTQRYGVTAQRICQANPGLSAENFRIGQVIVIPAKVTDSEEIIMNEVKAAQTTKPVTTSTPLKPNCRDMHKVERKETIFSISRLYGITEAELIAANPELRTEKLKKGKFLCIPYPKDTKTETYRCTPLLQAGCIAVPRSDKKPQPQDEKQSAFHLPFAGFREQAPLDGYSGVSGLCFLQQVLLIPHQNALLIN